MRLSSKPSKYKIPDRAGPLVGPPRFNGSSFLVPCFIGPFLLIAAGYGQYHSCIALNFTEARLFGVWAKLGVTVINGGMTYSEIAIQWSEYETHLVFPTFLPMGFLRGLFIFNVLWQSLYHDDLAGVLCGFLPLSFFTERNLLSFSLSICNRFGMAILR